MLVLLAAVSAAAQQVGQNALLRPNGTATLKVSTQLVVETVAVKDKKGNPIEGLVAKDFIVTEDGVPQTISFFKYEQLPQRPGAVPVSQTAAANVKVYYQLARTQISPEPPGSSRYNDRRLLTLYFDMTAMPPADQIRALTAAQNFIKTQMGPDDLVAILRYAGSGVDVLSDFTDDRDRLLSILETMIVGEGQEFAEATDDASTSDTGAEFGQDDSEFNIFNTDRQLAALQTAAEMLAQLSEKKALIYFASGLRLNGLDNQAQLHATTVKQFKNVTLEGIILQSVMLPVVVGFSFPFLLGFVFVFSFCFFSARGFCFGARAPVGFSFDDSFTLGSSPGKVTVSFNVRAELENLLQLGPNRGRELKRIKALTLPPQFRHPLGVGHRRSHDALKRGPGCFIMPPQTRTDPLFLPSPASPKA
ncbi:MAG: VWA domain-containing protein [Terriglobia bacterium]